MTASAADSPARRGIVEVPHSADSHSLGGVATKTPVVFDIGNVLIRWDPHPAIAAGVGEERASIFLDDEDFGFAAWNHAMDEGGGRTWVEAEREAVERFPHYADEIAAYRCNFTVSLLGDVDGTADIVRELHAAGVPLYAVTNWSAELWHHAPERFDVLRLFEDIVVSGMEGTAKPDLRIWDILSARVGQGLVGVPFVDDSARNIESAREAGLDAVLFTGADDLRRFLLGRGYAVAGGRTSADR